MFDAFHLARAQFAFTVAFHIVFPAFSIGLASYLTVLKACGCARAAGLPRPVPLLAEDLLASASPWASSPAW